MASEILLVLMGCLVLLSCRLVEGINLPGNCPKTPPSSQLDPSRLSNLTSSYDIIRIAPFSSDHPSYLFKEFNVSFIPHYQMTFITDHVTVMQRVLCIVWHYNSNSEYPPLDIQTSIEELGDEITLNSSINYDPESRSMCYIWITEKVKLWFDGDFLFIWCCVNAVNGTHDEAVIIISMDLKYSWDLVDKYAANKYLNRVKAIARKYISDQILNTIDWSHHELIAPKQYPTHDLLKCPIVENKGPEQREPMIIILIVVIFATITGFLVWYSLKNL